MKTIKTGTEYFVELPEGYQFVDENGNVINEDCLGEEENEVSKHL